MQNLTTLTLAEAYQLIPLSYFIYAIGILSTTFLAGKQFGKFLQKQNVNKLELGLQKEKERPKHEIHIFSREEDVSLIAKHFRYSLDQEPYILPSIIQELEGWISDANPVYASIDLESAMSSNKYLTFADTDNAEFKQPNLDGAPIPPDISKEQRSNCYYSYSYIGCSSSGTHIIATTSSSSGSGIFRSILFLRFQKDTVMNGHDEKLEIRDRILLKCIGSYSLGDRYDGILSFNGRILTVGKRQNLFTDMQKNDINISVD